MKKEYTIEEFKKLTKKELKEYGKDIPLGITRDDDGNIATYKEVDGRWCKYTCDINGDELTYKNSDGCWYEYTRDDGGDTLTYRDSEGSFRIKGKEVTEEEYNKFISKSNDYSFLKDLTDEQLELIGFERKVIIRKKLGE